MPTITGLGVSVSTFDVFIFLVARMPALKTHGSHTKASMLVIMDLVTMGAIPFMIKQTHCPNPACQAPTQTPPRSFDSSGSMIAPYLLGEKF